MGVQVKRRLIDFHRLTFGLPILQASSFKLQRSTLSSILVIYPQTLIRNLFLASPYPEHARDRFILSEGRIIMGWQTTFTLSRRAKGCHLVTDEVVNHIRDGLKDVKVLCLAIFRRLCFASISDTRSCTMDPNHPGGDVVPLHVQYPFHPLMHNFWGD